MQEFRKKEKIMCLWWTGKMYKSHDTLAGYGKMGSIWKDGEEDYRQRA